MLEHARAEPGLMLEHALIEGPPCSRGPMLEHALLVCNTTLEFHWLPIQIQDTTGVVYMSVPSRALMHITVRFYKANSTMYTTYHLYINQQSTVLTDRTEIEYLTFMRKGRRITIRPNE